MPLPIAKFWKNMSEAGTTFAVSKREKRSIVLLNRAWFIIMSIQCLCLTSHIIDGLQRSAIMTAFYIAGLSTVHIFMRLGKVNTAKITAILVININTALMAVFLGPGTHVIDFLLLTALLPLYLFEVHNRKLIFWGIAFSVAPFIAYCFAASYLAEYAMPLSAQLSIYKTTPLVEVLCLITLLYLIFNKNSNYEKEVMEKESEIEHKNDDLYQFINATSHDLRSPLRNIASYLQLLEKKNSGKLDNESLSMIAYTIKSVKHLNQLISDIYQYSVADQNDKPAERTDLNNLLDESLKQIDTFLAEKKADVKYSHLPVLRVAPAHISMLFSNLIINAVKYNNAPTPCVRINYRATEAEYIFSVEDNGIGIAEEYRRQIFEIFKRLHHSGEYEGTGVGLAICSKITDNYGGRIWVESEQGRGSIFYFTLSREIADPDREESLKISSFKKLAIAS
jgi:signal transduction histidine kinase